MSGNGSSASASASSSASSSSTPSGSSSSASASSSASSSSSPYTPPAGVATPAPSSASSSSPPAGVAMPIPSSATNLSSSSSSSPSGISAGSIGIIIAFVIVGSAVILAMTIVILARLRKKKLQVIKMQMTNAPKNNNAASGDVKINVERLLEEKPVRYTPEDLINFTKDYKDKLGSGCLGKVYIGKLPSSPVVPVVVKVLHESLGSKSEEQFIAEVDRIGGTYHKHLAKLRGYCFDAKVKALVYEYMDKGSLDQYLADNNIIIEWRKLQEIAVGIAKAIRYLHEECQKTIIHYNVKPSNVLLDKNLEPKVCDYGLAELCDREKAIAAITGAGYAAPELRIACSATQKCDVYSFGMLLFEMVGRRTNIGFKKESLEWLPRLVWEKFEHGELESLMVNYGIKEKDRVMAQKMFKVALWCVQPQPDARLVMSSVVRMLEGEQEIGAPVNPFDSMDMIDEDSGPRRGSTAVSISSDGRNER